MNKIHPYVATAGALLLTACTPHQDSAVSSADSLAAGMSASAGPAAPSQPPPTFTIDGAAAPTDMDRGGRCLMILWRKGDSEARPLFVAYAPLPVTGPASPSGGYLTIDGKPVGVAVTDAAYTGPLERPDSLAPNFKSRDGAVEVYVDAHVAGPYGGNQHRLTGTFSVRYHNDTQDVDMEGRLTC